MPVSVYESVKKALQDIIAPQLGVIDGKIESLRSEIKRLDSRIDGVEKGLDGFEKRFDRIEEQMRNLREEFHMAIDIHERLAALEAKIGR